jgi:hypothetical protein
VTRVPEPPIFRTDQWGARPPKAPIIETGHAPERIIFHHTAGHGLWRSWGETTANSYAYARAIQNFHMDGNGWNDSGHNFLVCRNGTILVGRHHSLPAVRAGQMVWSAHCPGQNDQPGIEHEHIGGESMTKAQFNASAWLMAWIIQSCGMRSTGTIHPHCEFFPTDCPGALLSELPALRRQVVKILNGGFVFH